MAQSLLHTKRFRMGFAIWWAGWVLLQALVLRSAGYSLAAAFTDSVLSNLLLGATVLLVATTLRFYLPGQSKYSYLLALCLALSLLWLLLTRSLLFFWLEEDNVNFFSQWLLLRGAAGFLILSCAALLSVLWYTLQDQQESEQRKTEADQLARDTELATLRQQLQPHFLFNSLNSINALVMVQPQKARTMIQQLSDFLRGTLNKDQKDWTGLDEELQHLALYLEIEKVRFGHRLCATVTNEASGAVLPVMLLQPVVENAIKFGLYDTTGEVEIRIEATLAEKELLVTVSNPFDPATSAPRKGTGFGLSSVQRRLYLLFARTDLLQTQSNGELFTTTIKIPQP